ncbi:MAG: hypothetical protein NTX59_09985 [Elusimicrobia bacterium]|nr:hypothetical protein [Elusimicrobiota bacterium]
MKKLALAMFVTAGLVLGAAAIEDDDFNDQLVSTDTAKQADEDDDQAVIQESDSDLAAFVHDYITKDSQLKGAFFIENPAKKQILRLKLVSLEKNTKDAPGNAKTLAALFADAGKSYTVLFYLQSSSFGGTEITKIELSPKPAAVAAAGAPPKK